MKQFLEGVIDHIVSLQTGASILQQAVMMQVKVTWDFFHDFSLSTGFKTPIATKVVCFSCLLKCLRSHYGKQFGPRSDCSCSGFRLFASMLNSSVMLGNHLQQTTSAEDILRCIFFLGALRVKNQQL